MEIQVPVWRCAQPSARSSAARRPALPPRSFVSARASLAAAAASAISLAVTGSRESTKMARRVCSVGRCSQWRSSRPAPSKKAMGSNSSRTTPSTMSPALVDESRPVRREQVQRRGRG